MQWTPGFIQGVWRQAIITEMHCPCIKLLFSLFWILSFWVDHDDDDGGGGGDYDKNGGDEWWWYYYWSW